MSIQKQLCVLALVGVCSGFRLTKIDGNNNVDRERIVNRIASALSHRQDASELPEVVIAAPVNDFPSQQLQQVPQPAADYIENALIENIKEKLDSTDTKELYKKLTHLVGASQLFRYIQNMKRTPEVFSQELYPLQRGAQQTEANLDKTLGPIIDHPDTVAMVPVRLAETHDLTRKADSESASDAAIQNASGASEAISNRGKRWWALDQLKQYRTPKSYSQRPRRLPKVDPVVYFIGIGK